MQSIHLISTLSVTGGVAAAVADLCNALVDAGVNTRLYTIACGKVDTAGFRFDYREFSAARFPRGMAISPQLRRAVRMHAKEPLIFHSHSLWSMPCVYPSSAARRGPARAIISPRGTLAPWAFRWHRYRKAPFWWLYQRSALRHAACLHATSERECQDIRRLGFTNPVALIPDSIPIPPPVASAPRSASRTRQAIFVGRLHPVKGIDLLLRAWSQLQAEFADWEIRLVGPDSNGGYRKTLEQLCRDLNLDRVRFVGEARDEKLAQVYREADLFVLPSHTENFGLVVAEALSHGLPAVVCKGAPWSGLEKHRCGWWVEHDEAAMTMALREAFSMGDDGLQAMGVRGRAWVEGEFSSPRIAQLTAQTYTWLLGGGAPPECVIR